MLTPWLSLAMMLGFAALIHWLMSKPSSLLQAVFLSLTVTLIASAVALNLSALPNHLHSINLDGWPLLITLSFFYALIQTIWRIQLVCKQLQQSDPTINSSSSQHPAYQLAWYLAASQIIFLVIGLNLYTQFHLGYALLSLIPSLLLLNGRLFGYLTIPNLMLQIAFFGMVVANLNLLPIIIGEGLLLSLFRTAYQRRKFLTTTQQ